MFGCYTFLRRSLSTAHELYQDSASPIILTLQLHTRPKQEGPKCFGSRSPPRHSLRVPVTQGPSSTSPLAKLLRPSVRRRPLHRQGGRLAIPHKIFTASGRFHPTTRMPDQRFAIYLPACFASLRQQNPGWEVIILNSTTAPGLTARASAELAPPVSSLKKAVL